MIDDDKINSVIYEENGKNNEDINSAGKKIKRRLKEKSKVFELGELNGASHEIFSSIDRVIIKNNHVYIFDKDNLRISEFNLKGDFIKKYGSQGRGSNEMYEPNDITLVNDSFYISDRVNSIVHLSLEETKSSNTNISTIDLGGFPEGICGLNNSIIVKSIINKKLYHRFEINKDSIVNSFGDPYKAADPIQEEILSEGIFSCLDKKEEILTTNYSLPYLISYKIYGDVNWITKIETYKPQKMRASNNGGMVNRWNNKDFVYDEYRTLIPFGDYTLLQIERFSSNYNNENIDISSRNLFSYLIDNNSGKGTYIGNTLPKVFFMNNEYVITQNNKRFPGIKIFKL